MVFPGFFLEMANKGLIPGVKKLVGKKIKLKMNTDPIADYLTRVRNAIRANHKVVSIPASNLKKNPKYYSIRDIF